MRNRRIITSPKQSEAKKIRSDGSDELVTVVLLSENHGHRMKSYGPISLVKLGSKTLVEKQVESIRSAFPNVEIIVCAGFEAAKTTQFIKSRFHDLNIRVVENQVHLNSNCCESARLCINNTMNNRILICGGGILVLPSHLTAMDINHTCVLSQQNNADSNLEIGIIENDNRLENFSLGVKTKYWSEVFMLSGNRDINHFLSIVSNTDWKNRFMFEAINEMSRKIPISVIKSPRSVVKVNNIKTLKGMI